MDTPFHVRVREALAPIAFALSEVGEEAVTSADEAAAVVRLPRTSLYHPTRVHIARAKMRHRLGEMDLGAWELDHSQRINTPVHLYSDDLALRFLHSADTIPAPGTNRARQAWYSNPGLLEDFALFGQPEKLLLIWSADFESGTTSMRVVHPVGTWRHGQKAKIDLSIPLDDLSFFEDEVFDTRDEEEDLLMPSEIEAAEEGREGAAGVSA